MKKSGTTMILLVLLSVLQVKAQNRTVLVEEGTGTWCQYCPKGIVYGHQIRTAYPGRVLLVAAHTLDVMTISGAGYVDSLNLAGLPSAEFDRFLHDLNPSDWPTAIAGRVNVPSPVDVTVNRSYNPQSRLLTVTVEAAFLSTLSSGDYRIGGILIEDGVTGPASAYNQTNIYSGGGFGPMGGYENLPNPVPASIMVYDHVARQLLGGLSGVPGSLPAVPQGGQNYAYTFNVTIDSAYDEEYVRVYGIVINALTGEILNSGTSEYAVGDFNARPFFNCDSSSIAQVSSAFTMDIRCHDPDNDTLLITAQGMPSWLTLQPVGTHGALLAGVPPASGSYNFLMTVSDGVKTSMMNVLINVITGGGSWVQLGSPGFTSEASKYISPSAINPLDGKLYTMAVTSADLAEVYQFDGLSWSSLGSPVPAYSFYGDIGVNPLTGEPWIFVTSSDGSGRIYKYFTGSWTQVGAVINAHSHLQIRFNSAGTPYLAYTLNGVGIGLRTWDGSNWNALPLPATSNIIGWTRLEIDSTGRLILLVGEFPPNYTSYSRIFTFDGSAWTPLGSYINPNATTSPSSTSLHQLAIGPGGVIYVACGHPSGTNVYLWNGNGWDTIAVNIDNGVREAFYLKVANNNRLFMVYQNTNNKATCKSWDGNSWNLVGLPGFTPVISNISLVINPDHYPSVTYTDMSANSGKLSSMRFPDPTAYLEEFDYEIPGKIYPNPASKILYLSVPSAEGRNFRIIDVSGRLILQDIIRKLSVNINDLDAGLYLLSIEGLAGQKFIKN